MKWFKHISDSLDDPFIYELIEEFGPLGYLVFFGTVEIYAREFKPRPEWEMTISKRLLLSKLQIKQSKTLEKVLKHIENSGKWLVKTEGRKLTIRIPKFFDFLDESTLKKLRQNRKRSGNVPEAFLPREAEADVEEESTIEDTSVSSSPPTPPGGSVSKNSNVPYDQIVELYHTELPQLPRVQELSLEFKKRIRNRWRADKKRQCPEWWTNYFRLVHACDFLMGKKSEWTATLHWLTGPQNMDKVLNGNYRNRDRTDSAIEEFLNEQQGLH